MVNRYRVVRDHYNGYEVQIRRWWFPFWCQCWAPGYTSNTHVSIEQAKTFIETHRAGFPKERAGAVVYED